MIDDADDLALRLHEPEGTRSVELVDDGLVAYAYLLDEGSIVGDVWLYNVGDDPQEITWRDPAEMPFRNPAKYCTTEVLPRLTRESEASCAWDDDGVTVSVDGLVWARLEKGSKPGWSRKARIVGPLAKPLSCLGDHQRSREGEKA